MQVSAFAAIAQTWEKYARRLTYSGRNNDSSDVDVEVNEPAIHEDSSEGDDYAGDLKVKTMLGMRLAICGALHELGPMPIRDATAEEGAGHQTESFVWVSLTLWNRGIDKFKAHRELDMLPQLRRW